MVLSNKRKLQLLEASRKAAENKKKLRLEEGSGPSEPEDSSEDTSSSDSGTTDDWSEEDTADSDDDTPADAANDCAPATQSRSLRWDDEEVKNIRGMRGTGSKSTEKRYRRRQRELATAASQSNSIVSFFERQRSIEDGTPAVPLKEIEHGKAKASVNTSQTKKEDRHKALLDLKQFLELKGEQKKKYGKVLKPGKDFHRRHLMVQSFLTSQRRTHEFQDSSRRQLATIVARTYGRGIHTGRKIVQWERSWVNHRTIPESKAGKHKQHILDG